MTFIVFLRNPDLCMQKGRTLFLWVPIPESATKGFHIYNKT